MLLAYCDYFTLLSPQRQMKCLPDYSTRSISSQRLKLEKWVFHHCIKGVATRFNLDISAPKYCFFYCFFFFLVC